MKYRYLSAMSLLLLWSGYATAQTGGNPDWSKATVEQVQGINTGAREYGPTLSFDGATLYFVSDRKEAPPKKYSNEPQGKYDFWFSKRNADSSSTSFGEPQYLTALNTPGNEGGLCISPDGAWYIYVSCPVEVSATPVGSSAIGSCDLMVLRQEQEEGNIGSQWITQALDGNVNSQHWESTPSVGPDYTLYFASNRPGGFGGMDIWLCRYDPHLDRWQPAENAGPTINTKGDELSPFVSADGSLLLFASKKGHKPSFGGYDLFVSSIVNNTFTAPENLGEPINSSEDELGGCLSVDKALLFFASERDGSESTDIYCARLR